MLTYASWVARFPESATVMEARFDLFLDDAKEEMGNEWSRWLTEKWYDTAMAYLVSHYIVLANRTAAGETGTAQVIRSKEVDDVSVEYAVDKNTQGTDAFHTTSYGQEYVRRRRVAFAGPRIVGG